MRRVVTALALVILLGATVPALAQAPPPPGPGGPAQAGPPPEAVLREVLGLTDQQIEALHGLLDVRRQAMEQLQPQIAEAERALADAIHADPADPTAIGELTLQLEALRAQVRAADDAFRTGFLALLTDEQRAELDRVRAVERALQAAAALHQLGL